VAVNLGNPTWVRLVADANTPAGQLQYDNWRIAVPPTTQLPTGLDSIVVSGVTLWGYARTVSGQVEWVMQPAANPIVIAVNAIPGAGGWTSLAARQEYYDIGLALLQLGVPGADLAPGLKRLHDAALANRQAANP
jgi:hypothetical protein